VGRAIQALPRLLSFALRRLHLAIGCPAVRHLLFCLCQPLLQNLDLGVVAPPQNVTAAVVQAVAVVLFVAVGGALDLPGPGEGAAYPAEHLHGFTAGVVEPLPELILQPRPQGAVRFDVQFGDERVRVGFHLPGALLRAHPKVHQPPPQVGTVHPFAHRRVVVCRHQQGEPEGTQDPLDRPFPLRFPGAYLQQLAGEGQVFLR